MTTTNFLKENNPSKISARNTWIFTLSRLDITAMVVPVIVSIWLKVNLSFSQMLLLQGIFALSIVLFEVPSGAISDTMKRKHVLVTGYTIIGIACTIYWLAKSFLFFALGEALFGLGRAAISGSDTSLMYDTLIATNEEHRYKKIVGRASTLSFLVAVLSFPISGVIGMFNLRLPLLITAISFFAKAILNVFTFEVKRVKSEAIHGATRKSFVTLYSSKYLFALLFAILASSIFGRIVFWAYQPRLLDIGINPFQIGLIFAGMNLIAAVSSSLFGQLDEKKDRVILIAFMVIEIVNAIIIWQFTTLVILSTMMVVQIARGGRAPIVNTMVQKRITSDIRATLNSLISAIGNLGYFILSLITTIFSMSLNNSLILTTVGYISSFIIFLILLKKNGKYELAELNILKEGQE